MRYRVCFTSDNRTLILVNNREIAEIVSSSLKLASHLAELGPSPPVRPSKLPTSEEYLSYKPPGEMNPQRKSKPRTCEERKDMVSTLETRCLLALF